MRPGARWAAPLAIGLLAAVLRLWAIDLAPFGYDEVDVLSRARAVVGGELTRIGPLTSWGIPDPPMSVYLMVPAVAIPRPALAAATWIAFLNVLAVVLTYAFTRRFFGPRVALAAGLLYAVNPWAVYFSRRTWAEIVPLFTVVALWAALEVICRRRAVWAVPFFLALALQVQTRILALIYAPAALLAVALFPRRWGIRWPALGIALGILVSLPYLTYLAEHRSEMLTKLAEGNRGIALDSPNSAAELLLWTAAGYGLLPGASEAAPWLNPLGLAGRVALGAVGALLVGGLGLAAWAVARRCPDAPAPALAALWLVLPFLTLTAQSSSVYLHYMVALFPAVFLVIALPLAALLESRRPLVAPLGATLLFLLCSVQLATNGALYRVLATYHPDESAAALDLRQAAAALPREAADQLGTGERYGVEIPLRFWQAVANASHAEAERLGLDEIWVLAGATDPLTAERPAVLDYLLRPRLAPHFLAADTLVFPVGRPALVLEAPDVDAVEPLTRYGARRASFALPSTNRTGLDSARLTLIEARSADAWARRPPGRNRAAFEGDVELLGFRGDRLARAGDDLTVVTYWRLGPNASAAPARVSVRLLDPSGRPIAQPDPSILPRPPEPTGERILLRRHDLTIPPQAQPGDYRLEAILSDGAGGLTPRAKSRGDSESLATIRVSAR